MQRSGVWSLSIDMPPSSPHMRSSPFPSQACQNSHDDDGMVLSGKTFGGGVRNIKNTWLRGSKNLPTFQHLNYEGMLEHEGQLWKSPSPTANKNIFLQPRNINTMFIHRGFLLLTTNEYDDDNDSGMFGKGGFDALTNAGW